MPIINSETVGVSGKPAQFRVVADVDLLVILPSAPRGSSPARVEIGVRASGQAVAGADVLILFPNHTWNRATTDTGGYAAVSLHTTELPMQVFVASPGHRARIVRNWTPSLRALAVDLEDLPDGGAAIFPEGTGHIPGLRGTLNPIRDHLGRTYLYASNIAINRGQSQPVYFSFGEELHLSDSEGREMAVRIITVAGRSVLVEYRLDTRT